MKFVLLTPASASEKWCDLAEEVYLEKINHFFKMNVQLLKPKKAARTESEFKRQAESEDILAQITNDDYVILFDERGDSQSSKEFAKTLQSGIGSSKKRVVFIIGGAFGVNELVRRRAQKVIKFSDMVFNHLVAKTVALEQIYRGLTIIRNLPYHND